MRGNNSLLVDGLPSIAFSPLSWPIERARLREIRLRGELKWEEIEEEEGIPLLYIWNGNDTRRTIQEEWIVLIPSIERPIIPFLLWITIESIDGIDSPPSPSSLTLAWVYSHPHQILLQFPNVLLLSNFQLILLLKWVKNRDHPIDSPLTDEVCRANEWNNFRSDQAYILELTHSIHSISKWIITLTFSSVQSYRAPDCSSSILLLLSNSIEKECDERQVDTMTHNPQETIIIHRKHSKFPHLSLISLIHSIGSTRRKNSIHYQLIWTLRSRSNMLTKGREWIIFFCNYIIDYECLIGLITLLLPHMTSSLMGLINWITKTFLVPNQFNLMGMGRGKGTNLCVSRTWEGKGLQ